MDSKEKKDLSETDICDLFITPAIKNAGWDSMKQIRREVTLAPGPVIVRGNMSSRKMNALEEPDTDRVSIIKLHGDIKVPGNCILSKNQYDQAYGNNEIDMTRPIPKLLEYYYKNSSLLFLGCSLNNDRTVQVFRAIKQKVGNIVIPQHFAIEQAPETEQELSDRNAYLLGLGITGVWFEKGQFEYVEGMLRLACNELRYRGIIPGVTQNETKPSIDEPSQKRGFIKRFVKRLFGQNKQ